MADERAVRVHGMLRGRELPAAAQLVVGTHALELRTDDAAPTTIAPASLDGVVLRGEAATLFVAGGDVVELEPVPPAPLVGAVFVLPELTRALRAFGSARARPGADHDRFFAPLLDPLRRARAAHDDAVARGVVPWTVAELFDASRTATALRATLGTLAAERFPTMGPDRRALEAELLDESEEVFDALTALEHAGAELAAAGDETRAVAWRAWAAALGTVFRAADRAWARSLPALAAGVGDAR